MGLDNLPLKYPCVSRGTAIRHGDRIDCAATTESGGCPWQEAADRPERGHVLGMLGTACWYRGKYGEYLLNILRIDDGDTTFFGDSADGATKSALSCKDSSRRISEALEALSDTTIAQRLRADGEAFSPEAVTQFRDDAAYAAWWLNWVAREGGGATCWF